MATPAAKPPKPAGQGGKAPAPTQAPNLFNKPGPSNTSNSPVPLVSSTANNWQQHLATKQPGGTRGSRKS